MIRLPVLALTAAAVLAITSTGCSRDTTGTPRASGTTASSPLSPSTAGQDDGSLRGLDPCGLITPAEARALGASGDGEPESLASSRGCGWSASGSHSFGVGLWDTKGIDDLTLTGRRTPATIGGRPAERVEGDSGSGSCVVIFPITDSSSAEASVQARTDTAKACEVAEQVARVIAPKLP